MKKSIAVTLFVLFGGVIASAKDDKMDVKIVNRQSSQTDYNYIVPARSTTSTNGSSNTNINANCNGDAVVNCNGSAYTTGSSNSTTTSMPAYAGSYHVSGATFTLLLPDGRRAVVNCNSKFAEHFAMVLLATTVAVVLDPSTKSSRVPWRQCQAGLRISV